MARGKGYLKSIELVIEILAIFWKSVVFRTSVFDLKTPQNGKKWKILFEKNHPSNSWSKDKNLKIFIILLISSNWDFV